MGCGERNEKFRFQTLKWKWSMRQIRLASLSTCDTHNFPNHQTETCSLNSVNIISKEMIIGQLVSVSMYIIRVRLEDQQLLTKVTSKNSSSSLRSENVDVMVLWKSFHRRQNCSVDISPVDIAQPAIWNKYQMSPAILWNVRSQQNKPVQMLVVSRTQDVLKVVV